MRFYLLMVMTVVAFAAYSQTQPATAPVDSMAYYNNTKKPAISEANITEYAPTIQADGKTIILQRSESGKKYELFEVKKESGVWGKAASLTQINAQADSTDLFGGPSLSFDGNTLFFFRSVGKTGNHDIFFSQRLKDGWSVPESIGAPINSDGYEAFPSISADGTTLYFVRQNFEGPQDKNLRKDKEMLFCLSIYKSVKDKAGVWGKPEKLPWPINQDCEKAPRIMADGKTLIFSSLRPGGKGGYDMYQSKLNALGEWSTPEPLNYVNTDKDDQLPCISAEGDLMYYTYNNSDIYSVVIPPSLRQFMNNIVQGFITDRDAKAGMGAEIVVTDALTSEIVMTLENNPSDGRYTLVLPVNRSFNIEFKQAGYSSFTHALDLRGVKKYQEIDLNVELFKTVQLSVNVSDKEIFEPLVAELKIKEKGQSKLLKDVTTSKKDGRVQVDLPVGKDYEIIISADHFKSDVLEFNVSGLVIYRNFEKYVELQPEKIEVPVNVSDLMNNSKVKAKVILKNKSRDEVIEVTGNQTVSLRAGDRYEMEVTSDQGYAFNSTVVDLTKGGAISPVEIKLLKLEKEAKLTLRDINFESNDSKLSDISFTELKRVVQLMNENPTLKVEVAAHTDDVGSDPYNLTLSQKRAKSVVDFFLENKVSPDRFVAKGYGESQSKVPNDTEDNKAINRRVELKILSI
jgi:Outer membrane protein and related peptidoglycan-associated (lipo)proteins